MGIFDAQIFERIFRRHHLISPPALQRRFQRHDRNQQRHECQPFLRQCVHRSECTGLHPDANIRFNRSRGVLGELSRQSRALDRICREHSFGWLDCVQLSLYRESELDFRRIAALPLCEFLLPGCRLNFLGGNRPANRLGPRTMRSFVEWSYGLQRAIITSAAFYD
jgi:hypothetical protein